MLRGLRWGELRTRDTLEPKLLAAPPTNLRSQLKTLLLDGKWRELLEAAEGVMGAPHGRGWLDLQRYVLTACAQLGGDYDAVAGAVRGALAQLLREFLELPRMTLMDDTPTANAETQAWLGEEGLIAEQPAAAANGDGAQPPNADGTPAPPPDDGNGVVRTRVARSAFERAQEIAKTEGPQRAIALLTQELARDRSPRARFIRRTQMARIMVDAGLATVAQPILSQLVEQIDEHKLEEWEEGPLVAEPLTLLYRCLTQLEWSEDTRQALYLRMCRLDPVQAMAVTK